MKKEEKTKLTYEKIIHAATVEFGTKSYEQASVNAICAKNQIPKGLLYHNFQSKDELYLKCVELCYQKMTEYLRQFEYESGTVEESIQKLLLLRQTFFKENPYYCNIFFNTVLKPPSHLQKELKLLRNEFDQYYISCFRSLLKQIELRDGISADMAVDYFFIFQEMFNGYFRQKTDETDDFHAFIEDHEVNLLKLLDIMLYGISK